MITDLDLYMTPTICPKYEKTFQILGKRWNALIIEVLSQGECRFTDMARKIEELSDRVLTERIKELEREGIIEKNTENDLHARFTYQLTTKGQALSDALTDLKSWADEWIELEEEA